MPIAPTQRGVFIWRGRGVSDVARVWLESARRRQLELSLRRWHRVGPNEGTVDRWLRWELDGEAASSQDGFTS